MTSTDISVENSGLSTIHWRLAWGVVGLQCSLQLGWIVYRAYQPLLLKSYGFTDLVFAYSLLPPLLGLIIAPVSGMVSDRYQGVEGSRMLPVSISVLTAGMIFLTVVGALKLGINQGSLILPILMMGWLFAVLCASSPNLAMLQLSAPLKALPRVAALGTLAQGVISAFASWLTHSAIQAGASMTFGLAAIVLFLGLAILRSVVSTQTTASVRGLSSYVPCRLTRMDKARVPPLLLIGFSIGLANALVISIISSSGIDNHVPGVPLMLLTSAVVAPWVGMLVSRKGSNLLLAVGIALCMMGTYSLLFLPIALQVLGSLVLGLSLSILTTCVTTLALSALSPRNVGLGSGLVLGGSGASALLLVLLPVNTSKDFSLAWVALACLGVMICRGFLSRRPRAA